MGFTLISMSIEAARAAASYEDLVKTARNEIHRFHQLRNHALEGYAVPDSVTAGCSIELGSRALSSLPEELIDVIKNEADRLALDSNKLTSLSGLGPRFAECTRLRYLVLRNNSLREFPRAILSVPTLEILDLKSNKIESLPEDLSRLHKLRSFSIRQNRVTKLPLCIVNMSNLTCLTTRRNPIVFPPTEEWSVPDLAPDSDEDDKDREIARALAETARLKRWITGYQTKGRWTFDGEGEMM